MIDAFKSAQEHQINLKNDQARLSEKLKTISDEVKNLNAAKEESGIALDRAEKGYIRDEISITELEGIRATAKESIEKLDSAERLQGLAVAELVRLEKDILSAQEKIISSRNRFATAERESLATAINQDTKLRLRMLEIYGAQLVYSNFNEPNWPGFLASIFTPPTAAEAKEAALKFKQKNDII